MTQTDSDTFDLEQFQLGRWLADKLGTEPQQISNAAREGNKCRGWYIVRRPITDEEREKFEATGVTQYVYRATQKDNSPSRTTELLKQKQQEVAQIEEDKQALSQRVKELEALVDKVRSTKGEEKEALELLVTASESVVKDRDEQAIKDLADALFNYWRTV